MLAEISATTQKTNGNLYIGELAQETGVSVKAIRFYEEVELLPPAQRAENGYRVFNDDDVQRLRFISRARSLNISLDDLRSILSLWDEREVQCDDVVQLLNQKLAEIEAQMLALQTLQSDLQTLLQQSNVCSEQSAADGVCTQIYCL